MPAKASVHVVRLVDANANRALEGLRVVEEIVRLHFDDANAYGRCRSLRHRIAQAVRRLPLTPQDLAKARDVARDVGREAPAGRVATMEHLLLINLQRTKEALRTLEECCRLFAPASTTTFQQLRFSLYDLERDLLLHLASVRDR